MASETHERERPGADIVGRHAGLSFRAALISAATLCSRILGFAREFLSALLFGDSSAVYDAFVTAWRIPNLFRRFLGEGALSTSLQTALTEVDGDVGDEAGRQLFWDTLRTAAWILLAVTGLVMAGVALLPDHLPGTDWEWLGSTPGPVREMGVRLAPFLLFVCLAALVSGALLVRGSVVAPSLAPALLNVVWIAALVGIGVHYGWSSDLEGEALLARHLEMTRSLAWGVLVAGLAQLVVQVPALGRIGLLPIALRRARASTGGWTPARILRTSAPLALGAAGYQISVMVDGFMAEGLLRDGGPTTLYFANRVQQFPLALVAVAATTAVFPKLKALGHLGQLDELRALHGRAHLSILFWALPSAAGLFALARPIVSALFEHGAFDEDGVQRTTAALQMLCIALPSAGAVGLVSRAYYALADFRTPVTISLVLVVVNVALNLAFVLGLDMDVEGLCLATALTSWGNLVLLWPPLVRRLGGEAPGARRRLAGRALRTLLAAAICGACARLVHDALADRLGALIALLGGMAAGAVGYGLAARLLALPELAEALARFRRRS